MALSRTVIIDNNTAKKRALTHLKGEWGRGYPDLWKEQVPEDKAYGREGNPMVPANWPSLPDRTCNMPNLLDQIGGVEMSTKRRSLK